MLALARGPGLLPRPPARRSARRLALVRGAAGAPAARRHVRHRRHGSDRHGREPPGAGLRHGGVLLRSVPARRHRARRSAIGGSTASRRCSPTSDVVSLHCPLTDRQPQPDRRRRARPDQAGRPADQHGPRRPGRPGRARDRAARRPAGRSCPGRPAGRAPDPEHPLIQAFRRREPGLDGRLLLTPHVAWFSPAGRADLRRKSAETVRDFLLAAGCATASIKPRSNGVPKGAVAAALGGSPTRCGRGLPGVEPRCSATHPC